MKPALSDKSRAQREIWDYIVRKMGSLIFIGLCFCLCGKLQLITVLEPSCVYFNQRRWNKTPCTTNTAPLFLFLRHHRIAVTVPIGL